MKGLLILSMKSMMVSKADGVPQKGLFPTGMVAVALDPFLRGQWTLDGSCMIVVWGSICWD